MDSERSAEITVGGYSYILVLSTRATKEIGKRYGGLADLGDKLLKTENFELALDEIVWLITLLANQGVAIHNLQHPDDQRPLLTEEAVELLTTPFELAEFKDAILEAMAKGARRHVESEKDPKNAVAG